jgi:AcrR family transcriptional regulator
LVGIMTLDPTQRPDISRRERKKDENRERIAAAALKLFRERGFAATTVDEIAQRADVAKGTFFNHFPRKEAVLGYMATAEVERLEQSVETALANPSLTAIERIQQVFEFGTLLYEQEPELLRIVFLEALKGPEASLFEVHERGHVAIGRLVQDAIARGEFRSGLDAAQVTEVLRGMFLSTTLVWLHCTELYDLRREVRQRLALIFEGLHARA